MKSYSNVVGKMESRNKKLAMLTTSFLSYTDIFTMEGINTNYAHSKRRKLLLLYLYTVEQSIHTPARYVPNLMGPGSQTDEAGCVIFYRGPNCFTSRLYLPIISDDDVART